LKKHSLEDLVSFKKDSGRNIKKLESIKKIFSASKGRLQSQTHFFWSDFEREIFKYKVEGPDNEKCLLTREIRFDTGLFRKSKLMMTM